MKNEESKLADLENQIKKQNRLLETLFKRIIYLEKENSRRRHDLERLNERK